MFNTLHLMLMEQSTELWIWFGSLYRELDAGLEAIAPTVRSMFALADAANDQPSADLLTQRLHVHEKPAWMLRSLLEN